MYKNYIFKNVWHVLLFLLFGQPSIVVVRPALNAGRTLSLTVSFLIFFFFPSFSLLFFFLPRRSVLFSSERESLAFTLLFFFFVFCFSTRTERRRGRARPLLARSSSGFSLHSFQVVHASLFFFFQIKVHELYHVLCPFSNYCAKFYIRAALRVCMLFTDQTNVSIINDSEH